MRSTKRHIRERRARGSRVVRIGILASIGLGAIAMPGVASAQVSIPQPPTPILINPPFQFTGEAEPGVPFPFPQELGPNGRRMHVGASNALAIAWDGRLIMYWDAGYPLWNGHPTGTYPSGFVFATFDKSAVTLDPDGRPDFGACFGTPHPRFAETSRTYPPGNPAYAGNDYPRIPGLYETDFYPHIVAGDGTDPDIGGLGELGLLLSEFLSNLFYPVPKSLLPVGAEGNPFSSDANGAPQAQGSYSTYRAYITFQDIPKFWDPAANPAQWKGFQNNDFFTWYETGVYPNGVNMTNGQWVMKRNGRAMLDIVVDHANDQVVKVTVLEKWKPFRLRDDSWTASSLTQGLSIPIDPAAREMWADNFEPSLTLDGHLMVGKGSSRIIQFGSGGSRVVFYYNQTAFGETGWQGPWDLHHLYLKRNTVVGGRTLAERYPLARQPIQDYDGKILGDANGDGILTQTEANGTPFEGGYPWVSHDGRFVVYTVSSGGVGFDHPTPGNYPFPNGVLADGGGSSNRAQFSLVGSNTGWQLWKVDHAAVNPSRHYFTAWDQESRTVNLRTASFGFGPGFWHMLRGAAGLPLRDDDQVRLHLVNSNRRLFYEVDLRPYQERDHGFYLPMTEMLDLIVAPSVHDTRREIDITRTPDLSGNGHFAFVEGGRLASEYFDLPTLINSGPGGMVAGLYDWAPQPSTIHPTWTSADTIDPIPGQHWAPIADWVDGVDLDDDGTIDTPPHAGRGNPRDMDSDDCWGRVGNAMFFGDETQVRIPNTGTPPELNPGTAIAGAAEELTASLWVNPLQNRTGPALLLDHHVRIELRKGAIVGYQHAGRIAAAVKDTSGTLHWIQSSTTAAPLFDWTHVAVVWRRTAPDASELRLFIDGVEVAGGRLVLGFGTLGTNTGDIRIGCLTACATDTDRAVLLLDEVALKQSDLTADEVWNLALRDLPDPQWDNTNLPEPPPTPFVNATDARVPVTSHYTADIARLGADLFHDVRLSANQSMSCATCHDPTNAFTDGLVTAIGFAGAALPRNTPTIYNQRFATRQFWDARAVDLEDQALDPVFHPLEMGLDWPAVDAYLEGDADYDARFQQYLGVTDIQEADVRRAIATYMRSPVAGNSRVDQFDAGAATLSAAEIAGRALFRGKARCIGCHNGKNFTDGRLWTTGTFRADGFDDGAFEATAAPHTAGRAKFVGAFKTPSLREIGRTAPYFHDGHAPTLAKVIDFYDAGGVRTDGQGLALLDPNPDSFDPEFHVKGEEINRPLGLTGREKLELAAYLLALDGETVDDGAIGFDQAPVATITAQIVGGGGPISVDLIVDVVDPDGAGDLDPANMPWTLEVEVGAIYDWSSGTVTPIPGGYRWVRNFPALPAEPPVRARAADWHGLWSGWSNL